MSQSETINPTPKVSIIIAVYNGKGHIQACIESLLHQSFQNFEIIIVNDGSTDKTRDILDNIDDPRIFVNHLPVNQGVAKARNIGAKMARGKYLAVLDADDIALPDRLSIQVKFLDTHTDISLVGSYMRLESEMGNSNIVRRPETHLAIMQSMSAVCPIINTTVMMRKTAFDFVGGYPEAFSHGEDYRFFASIIKHFKAANIPELLVIKRETANGLTFRISPWQHFTLGISHRFFVVREANLPSYHYIKAIIASFGILLVRWLGLNRERFKPSIQKGN